MAIQIGARPTSIDGCMAVWNEDFKPNTIRSDMDDLTVKVRRRTTGLIRNIDTQVTLKAAQYDDFITWFRVNQLGGAIPTRIKRPQDGKEIVVRARETPKIEWIEPKAFTATMSWEVMPGWETL
jgi:hypothetical protein